MLLVSFSCAAQVLLQISLQSDLPLVELTVSWQYLPIIYCDYSFI